MHSSKAVCERESEALKSKSMMDFNQHLTRKGHEAEMPKLNRKGIQWQQCRAIASHGRLGTEAKGRVLINVCFMTAGVHKLQPPLKCLPAYAYEPVNEHTHTHTYHIAWSHVNLQIIVVTSKKTN